jgi:AraC-like DNA-binding protein
VLNLELNITSIFLLLALLLGLVTLPLVLLNRNNQKANRILGFVQVIVIGSMLHNFFIAAGIYNQHPELYFIPISLRLALAPLLLYYVNLLTGTEKKKEWLAFELIPALAIWLFECYAFTLSNNEKWNLWEDHVEFWWDQVYFWAYHFQLVCYLFFIRRKLQRWKIQMENQFSETSQLSLRWLRWLSLICLIMSLAGITEKLIVDLLHQPVSLIPVDIMRAVMLLAIGLFSIRQQQFYFVSETKESFQDNKAEPSKKKDLYIDSDLLQIESISAFDPKVFDQIRNSMESKKLFMNAELSLHQLARETALPTKMVSSIINRATGKTFLAFVNSYRVQEVIRRLELGDQKRFTLLAIAFESGFNSKSTFNRVFREQTGQAPGEYVPNLS